VVLENSGIWGLLGSCVTLPGTTHAVYTGFEFIVSYINFGLIRDSICSDPGLLYYYICTVMCLCKWDSVFLSWVSFVLLSSPQGGGSVVGRGSVWFGGCVGGGIAVRWAGQVRFLLIWDQNMCDRGVDYLDLGLS
jgi:hypothetical protein